jgi:hypothetical protein
LRQLASERYDNGLDLIGTPDAVAERMGKAIEAIGGDGFLISTPFQRISRRFINEVCEGSCRPCNVAGLCEPPIAGQRCARRCANFDQLVSATASGRTVTATASAYKASHPGVPTR